MNSCFQNVLCCTLFSILLFPAFSRDSLAKCGEDEHEGHGHGEHGDDEHGAHGGSDEHEEGHIAISPAALKTAKVEIAIAGPATLRTKLRVNGRIAPLSSNVAHITSRFPGIVKDVRKDIGDYVKAGEVLAVIESNQNLQSVEVRALKPGLIAERHATLGEIAGDGDALFLVVDISQLWADFTVFQRDISKVRQGMPVTINADGGNPPIQSTLRFISPIVDEMTQSRLARAVIVDPPAYLAPGAFITGEIATGDFQVPIAVTYDAVQSIEGASVVFVNEGEKFEMRKVTAGRSDGELVEILSGLSPGDKYAANNTFILKAELGKSEAGHDHDH